MKTLLRSLALPVLALALASGPAFAADSVTIVSITPASPASLAGVPPATPMGPGNSLEIAFTYVLETQATGRIGFYTAGEPGNPPHTGVEIPFIVAQKGKGEGKTRISVQCPPGFGGCTIKTIRFDLFHDQAPAPLLKLFEGHRAVDYTFKCATLGPPPMKTPHGDKQPNITSARPGLYVWGSNPMAKHWVPWGTAVNLTAAESINPHPTPGNGQCAFNVEYYEKETNGVATGNFKNKLYSDANERAINGPFALAASELKSLTTQPYLDEGAHGLKLVLDAEGNVAETNEGDNSFSVRYILKGKCLPATAPTGAAAPK
jgi:hypothetical protein